ncbi:hypothetical protein SESBI_38068 [Sesbania bispinosa]|nr:hypothetical protein SESBI_38068 [Sesbania bispinosa]
MFSPCGRSFCYGDPSLRLLTRTIVDDEHLLEGVNCDQLVEKDDALQDQLHVEKAREKKLKDILNQMKNDEKLSKELSIKGGGNASHGEDSFVVVSPPSQGDDPFLQNTSNENADESDNRALITFSTSNQH